MEEGRRYYVVNMVRREATRLLRIKSPDTHRFVQLVCKNRFRIGRGQNVQISEEILHDCWDELELKQRRGIVEVRVDHPMAGTRFSFENRPGPVPKEPEPVQEPVPEPVPDVAPTLVTELDPVQTAEPVPEPEPVPAPEPSPEPVPKPDPTRMKKSELIRYVAELMGEDPDQYESMTKRELLELIQ